MTQKSIMDYVNVTAPKEAAKQSAASGHCLGDDGGTF
jgi:hypothetical protein